MIAHLIAGLSAATDSSAVAVELRDHLNGYKEHRLLTVLDSLELHATPEEALGPL